MTPLVALDLAAAVMIAIASFSACYAMSWGTSHWARLAWILLGVGALAVAAGPWIGARSPDWPELVLHVAVALFLMLDRRRH